MVAVREWLLLVIFLHGHVKDGVCDYNNGFYNSADSSTTEDYDVSPVSDVVATTTDIARKFGYPVESHIVRTEDGYLLTVHRIPGSPRAASSGVKTPVLLMHGSSASSDSFLLTGPNNSLGFLLADQGYDVWLGNARGNYYSRNHVTLSPKDPKFWDFSWHEIGVFDLAATIDHILATTNHRQVFYVGHSMGCTTFFVLTSVRPEYNDKIRLGVNMAPAVFVSVLRSELFNTAANNMHLVYRVARAAGIYELFPRSKNFQLFLARVCREGSPLLEICILSIKLSFGLNRETFDKKRADVLFSHLYAGASLNTLVHFAEIALADRFQEFDPTVTPGKLTREYDLSQVSAPVYLVYAPNDILVPPEAVMRLSRQLPNVVQVYKVPDDLASHADLVPSNKAKRTIYDAMINQMNRYR